jgi:hypothetical protein
MTTTLERYATPEEMRRLQDAPERADQINICADKKRFVFFAAFDGTDNDKNNVPLSGTPYQTNIGNLYDMAKVHENDNFKAGYYPGVGTGGEQGNLWNAGLAPTGVLEGTARKALSEFAEVARDYLRATPGATAADLSAVTAGFSRGNATQVMFAQMLDKEGLKLRDGTVVAAPHSVPITGMVMIDPVYTSVKGDLSLPDNVRGEVLALGALDEMRAFFKRADYSLDPRVKLVELPGNHVGLGGGYDLHGSSAAALQASVNYLRNSGADLGQVPPHLQFAPNHPASVYSEVYANGSFQTARSGERVYQTNPDGQRPQVWDTAGSPGYRATTPVPAPTGVSQGYAQDCAPVSQQPHNPSAITRSSSTGEMVQALLDAAGRGDVQGMNQITQAYRDSAQGQAWLEQGRQNMQQQEQMQRQQQEAQQQSGPVMRMR